MDIRFDHKVAVVTGAARGIGFVCAQMLVECGARVALIDILEDWLAASLKELQPKGIVRGYPQDLTRVPAIKPLVQRIRQEMGEIDILIQPAAIGPQRYAEDLTEEEWDAVFNINAKGLFFMMKEVASQSMIPRKKGSIVNFSSIAGLVGMRRPLCSAHYSGSKGAVAALTRQAAIEWARHGIRVNAVASGGVLTEMTLALIGDTIDKATALVPTGRLSKPEEVAAAVLFLASDFSANTTGHIMVIDGGGYAAQSDPGELTAEEIKAYSR